MIFADEAPSVAGKPSFTRTLATSRSGRNSYHAANSAIASTGIAIFHFFIVSLLFELKNANVYSYVLIEPCVHIETDHALSGILSARSPTEVSLVITLFCRCLPDSDALTTSCFNK